jgi:argininosuccinate lyase
VGEDVAGRLHIGRSRNDLQATYQRMAVRERLLNLWQDVLAVRDACIELAFAHAATILPGYTHLQVAQPITVGHWAIAVHDSFARDTKRLDQAYDVTNHCPLGAAALAGTGWPIDRQCTASFLGFDRLVENTLDAVASRDYLIDALAAVSAVLTSASRCATDLLLWTTQEFGFVVLDDAYAGISSIMPQKKNPLALEHCRARAAHGLGALASVLAVLKGIPLTHTRDTGKEIFHWVFDAFDQAVGTVELLTGVLRTMHVDSERMGRAALAGFATATELADTLVREFGLSFRSAHRIVSAMVQRAVEHELDASGLTPELLADVSTEVLGRPLHLRADALMRALDLEANVQARSLIGGPAPRVVLRALDERRHALNDDRARLGERWNALRDAHARLDTASRLLSDGP